MVEPPKLTIQANLKVSLKPILAIRLNQVLSLKEEQFVKLATELEENEIFQKLVSLKIISRRPPVMCNYIKSVYELKEEIYSLSLSDDINVYSLVEENRSIVELIKQIGQESYKKYFLSEQQFSFEEIAKSTGLNVQQVKLIFEFTNSVMFYSDLSSLRTNTSLVQQKRYIKIAKIEFENNQPSIIYLLPTYIKGNYVIDYSKLNSIMNTLSKEEKKKVKEILKEIELLNIKQNTLHKLLERIVLVQKEFLLTGDWEKRRVLTQREVAKMLSVDPSVICRIVQDKSIVSPLDIEYPLKEFLPNRKQVVMILLKNLLSEIEHASDNNKKKITDKEICEIVKSKYGFSLSRRSINYYKNELGIFKRGIK